MFRPRAAYLLSFGLVLAGCSIHPLPEDFTRDTTFSIVRKIRCEAREALDNISVDVLRKSHRSEVLDIADDVEDGNKNVRDLPNYGPKFLEPQIAAVFRTFTLSAVVLDFDFTIKETNDHMIDTNFRDPFTRGVFTLGLKGGKKLERQNQRKFQVGATFSELHGKQFDAEHCSHIAAKHKHILYPITGKIGLEELFYTFIKLTAETGGLGAPSEGPKKLVKFTDTLTFITTLAATATPKITLMSNSSKFRLSDATGTFGETRADSHKVTVSVSKNTSSKQALKEAFTVADLERAENTFDTIFVNERRLDAAGF